MDSSREEYLYYKILKIYSVLNKKYCIISELKRSTWGGILSSLRPICWRILLENLGEPEVLELKILQREEKITLTVSNIIY